MDNVDLGIGNQVATIERITTRTSHCCKASVKEVITFYERGYTTTSICTSCNKSAIKKD